MKILVNAISAENGGALSNLLEIYDYAKKDTTNDWLFITSVVSVQEGNNLKLMQFPKVKKNWINRLRFDYGRFKKIVKNFNPDVVYSYDFFQREKRSNAKWYFFSTNALYFTDINFSPSNSFGLWVRQTLLQRFAYNSIRQSDVVVVETEWMAQRISNKLNIPSERIEVRKHSVRPEYQQANSIKIEAPKYFFYPTSGYIYKNLEVIIKALEILQQNNYKPLVVFTLNGNENNYVKSIKKMSEAKKLSIKWVGSQTIDQMIECYNESILLFTSYLETVGLPLLEAKSLHRKIICPDLLYAKDALKEYDNVEYFNYTDANQLAVLMKRALG